jgi:hypothetical protein
MTKFLRHIAICCVTFFGFFCSYGQNKQVDTTRFCSIVDKTEFDTLSGGEFAWLVFKPINDTISYIGFDKRPAFIKSLTTKQKVLFHIVELERSVIGGAGFANFYYNYKSYYPEIIKALNILNDTAMLNLMNTLNDFYLTHYKIIKQKNKSGNWKYIKKLFAPYDKAYRNKHDYTMKLLEDYVRLYAPEFVKFQ